MTNYVFAFRLNRQQIVDLEIYTPEEFMKAFRLEGSYEKYEGDIGEVLDFTSAEDAIEYLDGDGEVRAGYKDYVAQWREEIRAHADRTISPETLSEEEREDFLSGYEQAGGYMGDTESPAPWCAPWTHGTGTIVVAGPTAKDWGACWWRSNREEIESLLEDELWTITDRYIEEKEAETELDAECREKLGMTLEEAYERRLELELKK